LVQSLKVGIRDYLFHSCDGERFPFRQLLLLEVEEVLEAEGLEHLADVLVALLFSEVCSETGYLSQ